MGAKCAKCCDPLPCQTKPKRNSHVTWSFASEEALSGPGRETMMSLFTIQSCQTDTLSLHAPALFDPIKAEAEYTEKLVALSTRFSLQRVDFEASKAAFEETKREAIAELENAVAAVEQKQEQAYAALDASKAALQKEEEERQAALAVEKAAIAKREDECRAIELQFFEKLQAIEAEETLKQEQRNAGTPAHQTQREAG